MTYFSPPTHIDFITKFKNDKEHTGFWIMTWINYRGDVFAWRRLKSGWQLCSSPNGEKNWVAELREDPEFYDFCRQTTTERLENLEKTLHDYMKKHGYEGETYEYWKPYNKYMKDLNEIDQQYKGEVVEAISEKQLLIERKKNKDKKI